MFKSFFLSAVSLCLVAGCASVGPATAPKNALQSLRVGVQSAQPAQTQTAWQPLVDDMGKKLGLPVKLAAASQADTVEALRVGAVDVVWLSSSAAIDAVVLANARAVALYFNVNGTNGYKSVLVTRTDTGITSLDEALTPRKYRFGGGAITSTSGYVLPQHFLFTPRRTTAEGIFKSVSEASHFQNLDALWASKVDVVVNNTTDLAVFEARTPGAKDKLRTLWESPLVPNDVLMVRADMPPAQRMQVAAAFINYGATAPEKELLRKASGISHFVTTDNRILEPVSQFKFAAERSRIEQNAALTAPQKEQALATLAQSVVRFKQSLDAK